MRSYDDVLRKEFLADLWRWKCELPEQTGQDHFELEDLKKSEWSDEFEQLMRNRLIMGAMRYGKLHAPGKPQYDRVSSISKRLDKYRETGNKEYLVDIANICLLEFEECHHPKAHFKAIDDGVHVKQI